MNVERISDMKASKSECLSMVEFCDGKKNKTQQHVNSLICVAINVILFFFSAGNRAAGI